MNWAELTSLTQIKTIIEQSYLKPQVIFKHSTRCSISLVVKNRIERSDRPGNIDFYFLDLIKHRDISNAIAETFAVYHESPQILLIKNGGCIYDESHSAINISDIAEQAA